MFESTKTYFENHLAESLKTNPDKGKGINAVIQFKITGAQAGDWAIDLTKAPGEVTPGAAVTPKCTFTVLDTDFLDIVNKKLNGQMAFMQGKLKVAGDMSIALKIGTLL